MVSTGTETQGNRFWARKFLEKGQNLEQLLKITKGQGNLYGIGIVRYPVVLAQK